jgi:hypothetical protein
MLQQADCTECLAVQKPCKRDITGNVRAGMQDQAVSAATFAGAAAVIDNISAQGKAASSAIKTRQVQLKRTQTMKLLT